MKRFTLGQFINSKDYRCSSTFPVSETQAVKGVAILFMLFAHLFNTLQLCNLCQPLVYIKGEPLVHYMIFGMNPVDFFIFLSGYGLYISHKNLGG